LTDVVVVIADVVALAHGRYPSVRRQRHGCHLACVSSPVSGRRSGSQPATSSPAELLKLSIAGILHLVGRALHPARSEHDHRRDSRNVHAVRGSIGWLRYPRKPGPRLFVATRDCDPDAPINRPVLRARVRPSFGLGLAAVRDAPLRSVAPVAVSRADPGETSSPPARGVFALRPIQARR
jgi:hypothetical protein